MRNPTRKFLAALPPSGLLLAGMALTLALAACGGGGSGPSAVTYTSNQPYQVGTTSVDTNLPPEPTLPADVQVCATLNASDKLVSRRPAPWAPAWP
jgi:polygalacturonase